MRPIIIASLYVALSALPTIALPTGISLFYEEPEFGKQNRNVFVVNDTDTGQSVRVAVTVYSMHPHTDVKTVFAPAHGRAGVGGTCAGDVEYSTTCGSNIGYRLLD